MVPLQQTYFPAQRVSKTQKNKGDWYANCIDYVISAAVNFNDRKTTEQQLAVLHGDMPDEFYKKTLNPYNAAKEKYTRFPATLRNYDIMSDIIRRYVSEYFKGVHEFIVSANNPEIVIEKNTKLKQQISQLAMQAFNNQLQQAINQQLEQGVPPEQINPQELINVEEFIQDFNEKYIDDASKQGQDLLAYIRSNTKDNLVYLSAFFNFVSLGECFTYSEIKDNNIIKENIPVYEAYPIPNNQYFVEDHDMFARRIMMSYQQIMDYFDDVLKPNDIKLLEDLYGRQHISTQTVSLTYDRYFEYSPEICSKYNETDRNLFKNEPVTVYTGNNNLIEVWHVVWRGETKCGILQHINQAGFVEEIVVDEDYELNKENGDISIEWVYKPQVYEGYRIGSRNSAIYPIKARAIAYERNGKLPYNGIMEILPMMGKFSIIKLITPFQILRNIMYYHREMVVAKNKLLILLIPESLIADDAEDKIYKMAADGTLLYDDSVDSNSIKAQQIRLLNANLGDYINQLTQLIESIKLEAWEVVDMNQQRYGEIAQSAGSNTTQEAIARASMGSVIITEMFDEMRALDYNRDLDYAKLAFVDGLTVSFRDDLNKPRYLSLDINSLLTSDLSTKVKNDAKELDKLQQLKQWAFSAAQNGDLDMAKAAIIGDNVSQISAAIDKFTEIKRQHEEQMQQAEQILKQQEIENKIREIEAKGEQDRLTEQLKYQYELQLKYIDVDVSLLGNSMLDNDAKNRLTEQAENNRREIENNKVNIERQKLTLDAYNAAADRQIKREQMQTDLKIAKTNKNKYDK